ncbi:MAG: hypothetical protein H7A38_01750 [Chlamydiales bacterium]|nr:hypothetical protein [Chlamydiales bacterium]
MTISAICSNFSNYAFQGITAATPALISVALRPRFCGAHPTEARIWTYFALGTFLPTLGLLHWHGYARKTSVMGALVFSALAKTLSDPKISRRPPPLGGTPPPKSVTNPPLGATPTTIVSLSHKQIPQLPITPALFSQGVHLNAEDLAKALIPGGYTVQEDGGVLTISDPHIAKAFKTWVGKEGEDENLTLKDLNSLKVHLRYRDLPPERRMEIRKALYTSFSPHLTEKPTNIPFLTGYAGQPISVYFEEGALTFDLTFHGHKHLLRIRSDGTVSFEIYTDEKDCQLALRYDHEGLAPAYILDGVTDCDRFFWHNNGQISPDQLGSKRSLIHFGPAHLELILFKQREIEAFLRTKDSFPATQVFEGCYELLASFQRKLPKESSTSSALAETTPQGRTSFQFGPLWSPVANSEDSYFVWTITREENNVVTLELEKQTAGRGHVGGVSERRVILKKGAEEGVLTVDIVISGHNDLDAYSSTSSYRLEKTGKGLTATPLGKDSSSEHLPLFVGMTTCFYQDNHTQVPQELKEDMAFLVRVFSTLTDIKKSPDTVVVDRENKTLRTLGGAPLPTERIRQLTQYQQGWIGGSYIACDRNGRLVVRGTGTSLPLYLT